MRRTLGSGLKQPIKTKIVCTIGPATTSRSALTALIKAGMSVARLNLSHEDRSAHSARLHRLRIISRRIGKPIGVLVDLPGPKIRVGKVEPEPVHLAEGALVTLTGRRVIGNQRALSITVPSILRRLGRRDSVFLADGTIRLTVREVRRNGDVTCRIVRGGSLFSGKGVNIPSKDVGLKALTPRDVRLLRFALQLGADFIGLSFTTTAQDIEKAKKLVTHAGSHAWVIAKIERRQAVENFDEIVRTADGVMVARGDLGVEMNVEDVPVLQKEIIQKANAAGKPVITATQMLESMVDNPSPTRAEVTDIANAIIDGTDAVMLSEETAVGKFPAEAVKVMKKVAEVTEKTLPYRSLLESRRTLVRGKVQESISFSACEVAYDLNAACIVAHTRTGLTAHRVSKFRSPVPIIALTSSVPIMNRLSILWGVYPHKVRRLFTTAEIFAEATLAVRAKRAAQPGQRFVVVCGDPSSPRGTTDLLRVQTV